MSEPVGTVADRPMIYSVPKSIRVHESSHREFWLCVPSPIALHDLANTRAGGPAQRSVISAHAVHASDVAGSNIKQQLGRSEIESIPCNEGPILQPLEPTLG